MARELVTRDSLRRELLLNAAGKPLAVGVGLAMLVASLALGTVWLLPVALVVYVGLAAATFFDGDEAERVGRRAYQRSRLPTASGRALPPGLSPELVALVQRARLEEARIRDAIAQSDLPFGEVAVEVDALAAEMEQIAARAQIVAGFLDGHAPAALHVRLRELQQAGRQGEEPAVRARERAAAAVEAQLRIGEALDSELDRFTAEMEHLIASLGVVHGQLIRISVSSAPQLQDDVAREVRELRNRVGAVADSLRAAADKAGDGE